MQIEYDGAEAITCPVALVNCISSKNEKEWVRKGLRKIVMLLDGYWHYTISMSKGQVSWPCGYRDLYMCLKDPPFMRLSPKSYVSSCSFLLLFKFFFFEAEIALRLTVLETPVETCWPVILFPLDQRVNEMMRPLICFTVCRIITIMFLERAVPRSIPCTQRNR